ncbi:MAG: OsmC family protein [Elusimicrobiota bacterium]
MEIKQTEEKTFSIEIRGHKVITDMHKEDGGGDIGMNPLELMVGSLGGCIGLKLQQYCRAHDLPSEGIVVNAVTTLASKPVRIANIAIDITLPEGFPKEKRDAALRVAHTCPIHATLKNPPELDIEIVS